VWIPFGTTTLSLLPVSNSKSNSGLEEAIESLKKDEKYDNSLNISFQIRKQNITGYDNKLTARIKQQVNEKVVQLLQHNNMHKFKYYKTLPDKMVQILRDDNMHHHLLQSLQKPIPTVTIISLRKSNCQWQQSIVVICSHNCKDCALVYSY
jgi:hypothetical protein